MPHALRLLIALLAACAAAGTAFAAPSVAATCRTRPYDLALLAVAALILQLLSLNLAGKGSMGVSAIGIVAGAAILGTGSAMVIGIGLALAQWLRRRGAAFKAVFDASNFALAAGAAALLFSALVPDEPAAAASVLAGATVAGAAYAVVNMGLLCLAISLSEGRRPQLIWKERFEWAWFALLAFGPLAGIAAINYEQSRLGGALSLLLLPLLLQLGMRGELEQTLRRRNAAVAPTTRG